MLEHLNAVGNSPFVIGMMMLLMNVGSRFIVHEFSPNDEEYTQNVLLRRITIFTVCFVATKDIVVSMVLTAAFVVLAGGLFRGKSGVSREGMKNRESVPLPLDGSIHF
jgi:hypothetical protein